MSSRTYTPDRWVIISYNEGGEDVVLGGWGGGYLHGDSWRRSTPIKNATFNPEQKVWTFDNESGSRYVCHDDAYGCNTIMLQVLNLAAGHVSVLDEDEVYNLYVTRNAGRADELP